MMDILFLFLFLSIESSTVDQLPSIFHTTTTTTRALMGETSKSPACWSVVSHGRAEKRKEKKKIVKLFWIWMAWAYRYTACYCYCVYKCAYSQWVCGFIGKNFTMVIYLCAHAYYIPVIGNRLAICLALCRRDAPISLSSFHTTLYVTWIAKIICI